MADFPYAQSPEKLANLMKVIPTIGKPDSFDTKRLQSLGYTSSHDTKLLNVLKYLGLIEDKKGGSPTEKWQQLRVSFGPTLAQCISEAYSELFSIYPKAYEQDTESLKNYFTANTSVGADTVGKITSTFQTLTSLADFSEASNKAQAGADKSAKSGEKIREGDPLTKVVSTPTGTVNINIQLQLPADSTGEVYDKLFKSLREHIWAPSD